VEPEVVKYDKEHTSEESLALMPTESKESLESETFKVEEVPKSQVLIFKDQSIVSFAVNPTNPNMIAFATSNSIYEYDMTAIPKPGLPMYLDTQDTKSLLSTTNLSIKSFPNNLVPAMQKIPSDAGSFANTALQANGLFLKKKLAIQIPSMPTTSQVISDIFKMV
jgi:hypothetical protein